MTTVTFDRIGRNHNPPVVTVASKNEQVIAKAVWEAARPHIGSSEMWVEVDLDKKTAQIFVGYGRLAGTGTVRS